MRFGDHRAGLNSNIIDGEESKWKQQIELVELYDVGGHGAEVGAHLLEDGVLGEVAPILFLAMASAMIRKCWRYSSTSSLGFLILPPGAMPTSKIIGISFPIILEASARNQAIRAEKKWLALHTQIHFHFSFFDVFLLLKKSHWG